MYNKQSVDNLNLKSVTPKFGCPRAGTYTTDYIIRQNVGSVIIYMGAIICGSDTLTGNVYIQLDGISGKEGYKVEGTWGIKSDNVSGTFTLADNTSIWLQKGYTIGADNRLTNTEIQGKKITFELKVTRITAVNSLSVFE